MLPQFPGTISLQGQVALITGAGLGVGRAIAEALAASGATIAANDLTPINVEQTVASITSRGGTAVSYVEDLTRGMPIRAMIDRVTTDLGRLDILVNAAQVRHPSGLIGMDEWDWQRTLDVNLSGPFLLIQAASRYMQTQGGGLIFNITVDGISGPPISGMPAYYAGKSGLAALSRAAAEELLAYNIRVHAICLDEISSPANGKPTDGSLNINQVVSKIVLLLCSPEAAQLTGQVFRLDGV
jgi:NAD(P)-dependent dehydrogenase (short-subunit alcohol dehydrogenase family)